MSLPRRPLLLAAVAFAAASLAAAGAHAAATVGRAAPTFTVKDVAGKTVSLADHKGKFVVLEWVNPGCPFVQKHYRSANMQAMQKDATGKGVVWLAVSSTAPDASDYRPPAGLGQWMQSQKAAASTTLMDDDGTIGRAYGARTTPHMYIVDPAGTLVYAGGIDDKPTTDVADVPGATPYVKHALAQALAGQPVAPATTRPYGCSIKYSTAKAG